MPRIQGVRVSFFLCLDPSITQTVHDDTFMIDIQAVSKQIFFELKKHLSRQEQEFHELNEQLLVTLIEDIRQVTEDIHAGRIDAQVITGIWVRIETHFQTILSQIQRLNEALDICLKNDSFNQWQQILPDLLSGLPEKISQPFDLQIFEPESDDLLFQRLNKIIALKLCLFREKADQIRKKKISYIQSGRSFHVHDFLSAELLIPAGEFLHHSWQKHMQQTGEIIKQVQQNAEQFRDAVLVFDALNEKAIYGQKVMNANIPDILEKYTASLSDMLETSRLNGARLLKDFNEFQSNMISEISHHWNMAGSRMLPESDFSKKKNKSRWQELDKKLAFQRKLWKIHISGYYHDLTKDIELAKLQITVARIWFDIRQIIKNKFYTEVVPRFNEIQKKIKTTLKSLNADLNEIDKPSEMRNILLLANRKLIRGLREDDLPAILNLLDANLFAQSFSGFVKRINTEIENISDMHTIFTDIDDVNIPPRSKLDDIAVKALISEEIVLNASDRIEIMNETLRQALDASSRTLARMDEILEYNLEGGLNLLRENIQNNLKQQVIEVTSGGLERVSQNIAEIKENLHEQIDRNIRDFDQIITRFQEDVRALADNEKVLALKIRLTRAKTKTRIKEKRQEIWSKIRSFIPAGLAMLRNLTRHVREKYARVQEITGLSQVDFATEASLTQYLTAVEKKMGAMPYIYQRLFRIEPLTDRKFFVGREEVLRDFQDDLDDFKKGYQPVTALVGEKGSGKTTVLNLTKQNIFIGFTCVELDFTETAASEKALVDALIPVLALPPVRTITEIINIINEDTRQRICIIENIHNLFLRTIDGFEAIHLLILLISKTRNKIYWIVSCGLYAWQYLDRALQLSSFFKRIIFLEELKSEKIQQMILDRHQISGYNINFTPSARILRSRQYKKLITETEKSDYLQGLFFERLSDAAEGNVRVAIYLWLSAIESFTETDIDIPAEINFNLHLLSQLQPIYLFSLAGFIQHENLTEAEHAGIFNQSADDSTMMLEQLVKRGLIIKTEEEYSVHPFFYRAIVKSLKNRNML